MVFSWFKKLVNSAREMSVGRRVISISQHRRKSYQFFGLLVERLDQRIVPASVDLPVQGASDLIYDPIRQTLYMPTVTGNIERYNLATGTLLSPWDVGVHLTGGDLSLDGHYLYVGEDGLVGSDQILRKVDLDTGLATNVVVAPTEGGSGVFDVNISSSGIGFVTVQYPGSGWVPLYELDTANDTWTVRHDPVLSGLGQELRQNTQIVRNADRSLLFFAEGNISSGPIFDYDAVTDSFPAQLDTGTFTDSVPLAVNRDGTLIAVGGLRDPLTIYDRNLKPVKDLSSQGAVGPVAFDPLRDIFYAVNPTQNVLMAFNTSTWDVIFTLPMGGDTSDYGIGQLEISSDGAHAFYTNLGDFLTPENTVRIIDLPAPLALSIADVAINEGNTGSKNAVLTVTLSKPTGQTVTVNYSTTSESATAGSDFTAVTGTVTFLPDQTTQTISIPILGDGDWEANETFQVNLSNPLNALISRGQAHVLIRNDDSGIPPVITIPNPTITISEADANAGPIAIFGDVTFEDPDTLILNGGNLTVSIDPSGNIEDQLGIHNQGTGAGQIGVDGTTITYQGLPIGTITGDGSNGSPLIIAFNTDAATPEAIQALIQNITYSNSSNNPDPIRTISLVVSDGFGTASLAASAMLEITPQDDPPAMSTLTNRSMAEDSVLAIPITIADEDSSVDALLISVTSSNHNLLPDANVVSGGSGANRTLTLTPLSSQNGTSTITVTVSDGTLQMVRTFLLTVTAVNDRPTISDITDQSTNEDTSTPQIGFTVADIDTPVANLSVTATSSNLTLVPLNKIVIVGTGTNRTVQITPAANLSGTTTITLTVSDGQLTSSDTFDLIVNPVSDPPTITHIPNFSVNEDTTTPPQSFTIGDVDSPLSSLTVTVSSSNQELVPDANLVLGGSGRRNLTLTPLPNLFGTTVITLTVSDGSSTTQETFTLNVLSINDPPTISHINGQSIAEDSATNAVGFTINDIDTVPGLLVVTASSSNPALIPNANLVLSGTGTSRTITATPLANATGNSLITVSVYDGTTTSTSSFQVTVFAVNHAPTVSTFTDRTINENQSTSAIPFTVGDIETAASDLVITASSSNPALIPAGNLVLGGSGTNRTLTATPLANQSGTAVITVTVNDGLVDTIETWTLTVNEVNDPPTITGIAAQNVNEDTATPQLEFTVGDVETALDGLVITATSTNQLLIPNGNLELTGSGASRGITVVPAPNQSGIATITVTVNDGQVSTSTSFQVTVAAVNDAPGMSDVVDQSTNEDVSLQGIPVTLSDVDSPVAGLAFTVTSSNQILVPNSNITVSGNGAARTLTITPATDKSGTTVITLSVSDGTATTTKTFNVTVNPVNDAPTVDGLTNQTILEDTATPPLFFTVNDAESTSDSLTVTGTSSNPALIPNTNIALAGTGNVRSLVITPLANQFGTATITIAVSDGSTTTNATFLVTVTDVNDAPTVSQIAAQTINEDQPATSVSFVVDDVETVANNLIVTASSSNPALIPNGNLTLDGTGSNRTLTFTALANQSGLAVITVNVNDGGLTTRTSFVVTVNSVNDAPTVTLGANQTVLEDAAPVVVNQWATGISTGAANEATQTLNFQVTTDHPELFSVLPAISSAGTLTYTVAPNANGQAVVTVNLMDDGGTNNGGQDHTGPLTFTISIAAVDDPFAFSTSNLDRQFKLGSPAVVIDPTLEGHDVDNPNHDFSNGQLTVSISDGVRKADILSLPITKRNKPAPGDISLVGTSILYRNQQIATLQGGKKLVPLQIQFGTNVTETAVNALLKALNFKTKGKQPPNSTRTIHFELRDATSSVHAETTRKIQVLPKKS